MGKKSREKAARRERLQDNRQHPSRPENTRENGSVGQESSPRSGPRPAPGPRPVPGPAPGPRPAPAGRRNMAAVDPVLLQARQLLSAGDAGAALDLLQRSAPPPGQASAYRNMVALALVGLHAYDAAYPLLEAAVAEPGVEPEMQLALAEAEINLGLTVHMERRIRRLSQHYSAHPGVRQAREFIRQIRASREETAAFLGVDIGVLENASFVFEESFRPMQEGDYTAAIEKCRQALALCPQLQPPRLRLGQALALSGDTEAAIRELSSVAGNGTPMEAQAAIQLVRLYLSLGDERQARDTSDNLLEQASNSEIRPAAVEALAYLQDHRGIQGLLTGVRDLNPREHFLLGVANANLGEVITARREVRSALEAGYQDPLVFRTQDWLGAGRTSIPYFPALDLASPTASRVLRAALAHPTPETAARVQALAMEEPAVYSLLEQMLQEDPPSGIRLLSTAGTPESLQRLREFASEDEVSPNDRILALGALRDAGEIAEDEPVEIAMDGGARVVTLGRHPIVPDRPIELPDQHAVQLFQEGLRLRHQQRLEDAYDRWVALDQHWPRSAQLRVHLAGLTQALGRMDEANEWLSKALEIQPDNVSAHVMLAGFYLSQGNLRAAIEETQAIEAATALTVSEFVQYAGLRESMDSILQSPLADALMQQADLAGDEETASANRELADMIGTMQKSMALTQYLRQRPVISLREDLPLAEVVQQMDEAVLRNAAWLFGMLPEMEELEEEQDWEDEEDEEADDETNDDEEDPRLQEAREKLAHALLEPERLAEGLPGLPDRDLQGLQWLLDQGGISPLDEYLEAFPAEEGAPGDMLLENGLVVEGRLGGKLTRMIPVDLRTPLQQALRQVLAEMNA